MTSVIPFGALAIHIVAPGTVVTDPETGVEFVVDDAGGVTNHRTGIVCMTRHTFDALCQFVDAKAEGPAA